MNGHQKKKLDLSAWRLTEQTLRTTNSLLYGGNKLAKNDVGGPTYTRVVAPVSVRYSNFFFPTP